MLDKSYKIAVLEKKVDALKDACMRLAEASVFLPDEMMYSLNDTYEVYYKHFLIQDGRKSTERKYQNHIIENFDKVFNGKYKYIGKEIIIKGVGRVDIMAECKETKRPVIIELKINGSNPTRQLLAYGTKYNNPILIGISDRKINNKHDEIIYHTYFSLNINKKCL